jgi:cell wall integrity and stress response component
MRTSTILAVALVAFSRAMAVSAAVNPSRVIARAPDATTGELGKQSPSEFPLPGALKSQGCFSADGNFTLVTEKINLASGSCGEVCTAKKKNVMALHGGQCLCGSYYPPKKSLVSDKKCNYPCPYYDKEACGGLGDPGYWSVFNTGIDLSVENLPEPKEDDDDDKKSKSSSVASTTAAESTAGPTAPAATETQGEGEDQPEEEKKSGPNTAGIAAGVVVGVAVIAGGIGGFFFWMRRRRNAEIEEDHRRNAAVNAFISGSKPPSSHGSISMTDSRLDPVLAHRRMSDGSIADNEDYSRRILRVTNA